jgi:hypothetical protein
MSFELAQEQELGSSLRWNDEQRRSRRRCRKSFNMRILHARHSSEGWNPVLLASEGIARAISAQPEQRGKSPSAISKRHRARNPATEHRGLNVAVRAASALSVRVDGAVRQ